ncbi:ArdC family protein [Bizionia myxarmorum]|uniref:DUF1738 domain-containing protein n=1 Tax=Bizionia myxarmorum TaxID=291186 RepID=A0A5D0RC37_9FLAO|nr:zincin-like metallopeptidase domain-containing protein [Bizionia myxarmorum]TYB78345.1 DUF1738 domain-containing protein [Bizionia myxarmorum]
MISLLIGGAIALITKKDSKPGLGAPRHSGLAKEGLDNCGRLKPGFMYDNEGNLIRVEKVKKSTKKEKLKSKILSLKEKFNLQGLAYPAITKCGLGGGYLANGHEILSDNDLDILDDEDYNIGLGAAAKDVEQMVNELILDKINTGEPLPAWKQSWANKASIPAQNFVSKKPYSGTNSIILNVLLGSIMPTPYYLTGKQIKDLGGNIKKGSKTVPLVYYNFVKSLKDFSESTDKENALLSKVRGYEVKRRGKKTFKITQSNYKGIQLTDKEILFLKLDKNEYWSKGYLKYYRVFNIADTEGIEYEVPEPKLNTTAERIDIAEAIISSFVDKPKIKHNPKEAKYNTLTDILDIPNIEEFDTPEEYYSTMFHELIHSTLHQDRLNRKEKYEGKEKDASRAFEELIAELGASYLCGLCGILEVTHINQAAYLKQWYQDLVDLTEENPDFFIFATQQAQKAVDYIIKDFDENNIKKVSSPSPEPKPEPKNNDKEKAKARAKALKLKIKLKLK